FQAVFAHVCHPGSACTDEERAAARRAWERMRFIGFDSFEGLPAPEGVDAGAPDLPKGKFDCSEPAVRGNIAAAGVPMEKVVTVPGWYADTLTPATREQLSLEAAAIVHIDCDLYESAKRVLDFVTPLLCEGAILIFDDWYCFKGNPDLGEQRACREWLDQNGVWTLHQYQKEGPWANSFIVGRR
ncbi:MAG: hypothetical protein JXR94_22680, partial [Candidatus Hydrogenedentes bacterium]|nr:hypothetical protein [Candidatus Hydrogenedentota bacterium]